MNCWVKRLHFDSSPVCHVRPVLSPASEVEKQIKMEYEEEVLKVIT